MSDNIKVFAVSQVRTCTIDGNPEAIIWAITSGDETRHYRMTLNDFAGLAKQMQIDVHLLRDKGTFSGPLSAN